MPSLQTVEFMPRLNKDPSLPAIPLLSADQCSAIIVFREFFLV